jgi:poly-beta-1,6-N-acetyl-D-glucosamine biosynthesis protein PgaD
MNRAHSPLVSFVFDTARVPWVKRFLLKMLDVLAWTAWLLLWLPLITGLVALFKDQTRAIDPVLISFVKALGFGAVLLLTMWLLFMAWSGVRDINFMRIRHTLNRTKQALHIDQLAKVFALKEDALQDWQKSQIMLAHHSEDTGWLEHIDELPHITGRAFDPADYAIIIKPH